MVGLYHDSRSVVFMLLYRMTKVFSPFSEEHNNYLNCLI
ncbi:hypothetical protein OIU78_016255 [Salix suchowensis]|nr:hypothetical protein OIU78_016255 [Salix suchowensis]